MTTGIVNNMFENGYIGKARLGRIMQAVTGYKKGQLIIGYSGEVYINALQGPIGYKQVDLNAGSKCPNRPKFHAERPSRFCTCGFYSYDNIQSALSHLKSTDSSPILQTVCSGKMLMYEKGRRSGRQRVEAVIFHACSNSHCHRPADRVYVKYNFSLSAEMIIGYCASHGEHFDCNTFKWLEDKMESSLTNGEPRITVRQLNENTIPWDGTNPPAQDDFASVSGDNKSSGKHMGKVALAVSAFSLWGYGLFVLVSEMVKVAP